MPSPHAVEIKLSGKLRTEVDDLARSSSAPHRSVVRAKIISLAAAGLNNVEIAARTGMSVRSVRRWRKRFSATPTMEALGDRERSGRPPQVPLATRAHLISLACARVDEQKTPFRVLWTHAALQNALIGETGVKVSLSEIGRILRNSAIRPHHVRMWLNSQDPQFAEKSAAVCRHYVEPEAGVTVICVDEKRLFAHERKPGLKPPNQRHGSVRKEFEYSRHGSSTLIAAFDTKTGKVYSECRDRRTADDLIAFMEAVAARTPGVVIVIWDNLNVHHDGKDSRWTAFNERHGGRFRFVHTPTHASWLNQVECWFSILERRLLRHGSFPNVATLNGQVEAFIAHWNQVEAHPFKWTFRGTFEPRREVWHGRFWQRGDGGRLVA